MSDITNSDYSNLGSQNLNPSVSSTPSSSEKSSSPSPLSASSIQESEMQALMLLMISGIPILSQPDMNGNGTGVSASQSLVIGMSVEAKKNDIINTMWDTYIKNIRDIAERQKAEDIKKETVDANKPGPKSSAEYFSFLMAISGTQRTEEIDGNSSGVVNQFNAAYNQWIVNPIDSGNTSSIVGAYPSSAFISGCVACSPDAVRSSIGADSALIGIQLSSSPVADALFAVGPTSGLPGDYQAAAALVAALLNGGAVYRTTADTVANAGGGQQVHDLNFAMNYAKNVMAIVTKNIGEGDPTDPYRASQNNMVRLMLSAMALNMVYRAAYGGMQGKEFDNLLGGESKDLPKEIARMIGQLVSLVNFYLPKDPKSRAETIARLMEYVDSKDSVDSMLATSRLFTGFLKTDELDANRLASGKS